jgi:cold shock protein
MEGYRRLREGQKVEFSVENGDKGEQAANVVPLSE